jgi:hypothetical protein
MRARKKGVELPLPDRWDGTPESKARLHKDAQLVLRALAAGLAQEPPAAQQPVCAPMGRTITQWSGT